MDRRADRRAARPPAARSGSTSVDRARGEVVLARNDLYWDTPTVLDQLVLRRLDPPAMATGLATGDVDIALPAAGTAVAHRARRADPGPARCSRPRSRR